MSSFTRTLSWGERSQDSFSSEDPTEASSSQSLHMLVREVLSDKKHEEIPHIVESMLSKVVEEFQHRLASQAESVRTTSRDTVFPRQDSLSHSSNGDMALSGEKEEQAATQIKDDCCKKTYAHQEGSKGQLVSHKMLVKQQKNIQVYLEVPNGEELAVALQSFGCCPPI